MAAILCLWQAVQLFRYAFSEPKGLPLKISAALLCAVLCTGIGVCAYDFFSFTPGHFLHAVVVEKGPDCVVMQQDPFPPVRIQCTPTEYPLLEEGGRYVNVGYITRKLTGESYLTDISPSPEAGKQE